jgi:hypothetical protein
MRVRWLVVGAIAVAGCETLLTPAAKTPPPVVAAAPVPLRAAAQPPVPSPVVAASATQPAPALPPDALTLFAECQQRGDPSAAAAHLGAYVREHPDQLMFRAHLAELLLTLDRPTDAKAHFERFVAAAQDAAGPPKAHLVHCHTRLMEIGQRAGDRFAEVFHRGAGLLLLVNNTDADADTREEILCRALKALAEAKELRPTDPRAYVYLADAHDRAGNRRAADVARAAARHLTAPGALTPPESRRLAFAATE